MTLSHEQIVTLQLTKGIGAVSINKICDAAEGSQSALDVNGLYELIDHMIKVRELNKVSLPDFNLFYSNFLKAKHLLSESEMMGINVVSKYDDCFPSNLLHAVDETGKPAVPVILYYKGDLSITKKPAIAIIGTREPSEDGVTAGHFFGKVFGDNGFNIVSGLAIGCDTCGHEGALQSNGGSTTAFLAHGLDTIYPKENEALAERILNAGGLLMSEYPIGERVNRYNLVARDRLQAALANGTLVVQTGVRGGTMHAVRATIAAGKPVFVAKFKQATDKTAGNELLASNGAKWVDTRRAIEEIVCDLTSSKHTTKDCLTSCEPTLFG